MNPILKKGKDWVQLSVEPKVYPLSSVYAAGYVFLERAYIYLDQDANGKIVVWLFARNAQVDMRTLGLEFYNELLNYAHYFSSLKANAEAVKTLMQRALFSAAPSLASEAAEKKIEELIDELEKEEKDANKKK